ncbi:hypothetical protein, partial [Novosphingobium sediminicola]|uniref:hypothetical protein n=1 Tax=Novosphingobium sediminicola TaxID=563162 RepID=UPI001C84FD08
ELTAKLPSLHRCSPFDENTLSRCPSNRQHLRGKMLERRSNSAFFRYVSATTFADDEYPGPLEHWSLTTLNHCVDVVSVGPPRVVWSTQQG